MAPVGSLMDWIHGSGAFDPSSPISIVTLSTFLITAANWGIIMTIMVCKMYLLYYDHEYARILASEKWAIFIDPSIIKNNWYLNNKQKYGSSIWMIKNMIFPIITIWCIIDIIIFMFHRDYIFGYILIWFIPHLIIGIRCWRKYPRFNDDLGIRKEIKYTMRLCLLFVVSLIIASVFQNFVYSQLRAMLLIITQIACTIYSYILVIYPQRANESNQEYHKMLRKQSTVGDRVVEWKEIVSTIDGYEQFASFLEREFSMENLLFVTEYVQLKHAITKIEKYHTTIHSQLGLDYFLTLPSEVPKSIIAKEFEDKISGLSSESVQGSDTCKMVYNGVKALYTKYIDSRTANMEVNISSTAKYNMAILFKSDGDSQMTQMDINQILVAMETAVKEISHLMNDSTSRFRRQSIFSELYKMTQK